MSTQEIKDVLSALYPGWQFSRRSKVMDVIGYVHRGFESKKPGLKFVVTCYGDGDDAEITDIIQVDVLPDSAKLKKPDRPWMGDSLKGYVFAFCASEESVYPVVAIWPKWYLQVYGCMSDGEGCDSWIGRFGGERLTESTYEFEGMKQEQVRHMLLFYGAEDLGDDWTPESEKAKKPEKPKKEPPARDLESDLYDVSDLWDD